MINLLPVISRITLLLLVLVALADRFIPRVKLPGNELIYGGLAFYLLLVLIELVLNIRDSRVVKDTTRFSFNYLTRSVVFRKVILFVVLAAIAVVIYVSAEAKVLRILAAVIAAVEILVFFVRVSVNYYRVVIDGETISVIEDQRKVAHYSRIKDVEFRYDVFFLRMKDNNVYEIHLPTIRKGQQTRFIQAMVKWLEMHSIPLSEEGKQKLQPFL